MGEEGSRGEGMMGRGVWAWQTIGECVVSAVKYIIIRSISWNEAEARIETGNC